MTIDPRELLAPYLENDLSEVDRARLEQALRADQGLRQELEDLRSTLELLRSEAGNAELWCAPEVPGAPLEEEDLEPAAFLASLRTRLSAEEGLGRQDAEEMEDEEYLWPAATKTAGSSQGQEASGPVVRMEEPSAAAATPAAPWSAIVLPGQEAPARGANSPSVGTRRPRRGANDFIGELPTADLPTANRPKKTDETTKVIQLRAHRRFPVWAQAAGGLLAACVAVGIFLQQQTPDEQGIPVGVVADGGAPATLPLSDSEVFQRQYDRAQDVLERTRRQEEELKAELQVAMTERLGQQADDAEAPASGGVDADIVLETRTRLRVRDSAERETAIAEPEQETGLGAVGSSRLGRQVASEPAGTRGRVSSLARRSRGSARVTVIEETSGREAGEVPEDEAVVVPSSAEPAPPEMADATADEPSRTARSASASAPGAPPRAGAVTARTYFGGIEALEAVPIPSRLSMQVSLKVGSMGGRVRTVTGVRDGYEISIMELEIRDIRRPSFEAWLGGQGVTGITAQAAPSFPGWSQYRLELVP